jgi:catechol 2,3-dioxygenase-like lactoylglutathione lyase family enzyme
MRPCLTHIALFVADVERTIGFYRRYCDLHVVHDRVDGGVRVVWLSEQPQDPSFVIVAIHLPPGAATPPPRMAHLGYDVATRDAVDEVAGRARADGVLTQEPADGGRVVGYYCMLADPDGYLVEFSHGQSINPHHV